MKAIRFIAIVTAVCATVSIVEAGRSRITRKSKVNTKWEKKADTNKDGIVGRNELKKAKSNYLKNKSEVDTKWEKKADKNKDGKVDAVEIRHWRKLRRKNKAKAEKATETPAE